MVGRVRLSPEMELLDVLYVQSLTCNFSIHQLIADLNCHITFTNVLCVIQNHISKMSIGTGELSGKVYCFGSLRSHKVMKVEQADPFLV